MSTGILLRGGLITAIYSRSLRLTPRARVTLSTGELVNHISTDVSRIDFCAGYFHMSWSALIQLIICLTLLLINLGPSALAGFALLVFVAPIQTYGIYPNTPTYENCYGCFCYYSAGSGFCPCLYHVFVDWTQSFSGEYFHVINSLPAGSDAIDVLTLVPEQHC
ncbi:hypothetical protein AZE42_08315 [Rhizopogon vesiculosus]|uniref:ABC transmembrane type-1 domain-containing protein n=1 Tax=Rhizopogon vesiculosus TaxID=180088 RepID=A0A1J8PGR5_9AGAM|nr:hypothetical protein AZE42_08315 [Rhizopogon vesiculosus]